MPAPFLFVQKLCYLVLVKSVGVVLLSTMKGTKYNSVLNLRVTAETKQMLQGISKFSKRKVSDVAREALEKGLKG